VEQKAVRLAGGGDGLDFRDRVDATGFSGLGDGDDAGLGKVNVLAPGGELVDGGGSQLAVGGVRDEQLGAVGEELRRAAFVGFDVGLVGADDSMIGLAERRERKGVSGGAVEDEE
jgi:hypothetical protein